jgi:Ribbon-helix-helix domain
MQRTNIYLAEEQLDALRRVGESRDVPVASLVREAIDEWLEKQGVHAVAEDEWRRRFEALLRRRDKIAKERGFTEEEVERDVMEAVREVRRSRAARRR